MSAAVLIDSAEAAQSTQCAVLELNNADLAELLTLETDGFSEHERWSQASWETELARANQRTFGIRLDGKLVAASLVSVLAPDSELLRIAVDHTYRRRHLAAQLLGESLAWAKAEHATRMLLEVREDNTAARALYNAAGFVRLSQRDNYYGPGATALVLEHSFEAGDAESCRDCHREDTA